MAKRLGILKRRWITDMEKELRRTGFRKWRQKAVRVVKIRSSADDISTVTGSIQPREDNGELLDCVLECRILQPLLTFYIGLPLQINCYP